MVAVSNGRIIGLSTPAGKRGWYYQSWHGHESWHRVQVLASDCPRISKEFLDEELRELGALRFSEEYQLAWLDPTDSVFTDAVIMRRTDGCATLKCHVNPFAVTPLMRRLPVPLRGRAQCSGSARSD